MKSGLQSARIPRAKAVVAVILVIGGVIVGRKIVDGSGQAIWVKLGGTRIETPSQARVAASDDKWTEVVVTVIGSGSCAACGSDEFLRAYADVRRGIAAQAARAGQRIRFVGVGIDESLDLGLGFLRTLGPLNEVSLGSQWLNHFAVTYMWRDWPAASGVPQIVVMQRRVTRGLSWFQVDRDSLVVRKLGVREISSWASRGAPLGI